jgi:arginyl-tRNA synthetase
MKQTIIDCLTQACLELYTIHPDNIELTRPEGQFGDYAVNLALQLTKDVHQPPRDIAEALAKYLEQTLPDQIESVSVAGPGFINIKLTTSALIEQVEAEPSKIYANKNIVIEYSDPNPFKVLHVGHAYTTIVGDAIANLLETAGANMHRVNYGGDVGLHVARTLYQIINDFSGEDPEKLAQIEGWRMLTSKAITSTKPAARKTNRQLRILIREFMRFILTMITNQTLQKYIGPAANGVI